MNRPFRIGFPGEKYHRLTIISEAPKRGLARRVLCECECGTFTTVTLGLLRNGNTKSCGCLRNEVARQRIRAIHGEFIDSPEHASWISMRRRCHSPSATSYNSYGGRGIKVCKRWDNFQNFLIDMGPRPSGTTLDRIDNEGDYHPENCRWATLEEQANNRRCSVWLSYQGESKPLAVWARDVGINYFCLVSRIKQRGWSVERALTTPVKTKHRRAPIK